MYKWIINDLIPHAIYFGLTKSSKKRFWRKLRPISFEIFRDDPEVYNSIFDLVEQRSLCSIAKVSTIDDFASQLRFLQEFFHLDSFNDLPFCHFYDCGEVLVQCLQNDTREEGSFWDYLAEKLGCHEHANKKNVLESLHSFLKFKDNFVHHFKVDLLLRSLIHFVEHQQTNLDSATLRMIANVLIPLEKFMYREQAMASFHSIPES